MPLNPCPDCGNECSSLASSCPKCGRPLQGTEQLNQKSKPSDEESDENATRQASSQGFTAEPKKAKEAAADKREEQTGVIGCLIVIVIFFAFMVFCCVSGNRDSGGGMSDERLRELQNEYDDKNNLPRRN